MSGVMHASATERLWLCVADVGGGLRTEGARTLASAWTATRSSGRLLTYDV
jgi:hypothetical protein